MGHLASLPFVDNDRETLILNNFPESREVPYRLSRNNTLKTLNAAGTRISYPPKNATRLKVLLLNNNNIKAIKSKYVRLFQQCTSLEQIGLSGNLLETVPQRILDMPTLKAIDVSYNKLTTIQINLTTLEKLDLNNNRFEVQPSFVEGNQVSVITIDFNLLTEIDLMRYPKLTKISAIMNFIENVIITQQLQSLTNITLQKNRLRNLPDFKRLTPNLTILDVSENMLTQFPSLPDGMRKIIVDDNEISTTEDLARFTRLDTFSISKNKITHLGVIPETVTTLNLSHNAELVQIEQSSIPRIKQFKVEMSPFQVNNLVMPALGVLFLKNMRINTFPRLACAAAQLENLELDDNDIEYIDPSVFEHERLTKFNINHNRITELPIEIFGSRLTYLNISWNPISILPQLPPTLEKLYCGFCGLTSVTGLPDRLTVFVAPNNKISVFEPSPNLTEINLSCNDISIVPNLPQSLTKLDLSTNRITEITLNNNTQLKTLDLSFNKLTSFLCSLPNIYELKVNNNPNLCSSFTLDHYPKLKTLDVRVTRATYDDDIQKTNVIVFNVDPLELPQKIDDSKKDPYYFKLKYIEKSDYAGFAEMQGGRSEMEDAVLFNDLWKPHGQPDNPPLVGEVFGVFDGHGGHEKCISAFHTSAVYTTLLNNYNEVRPEKALNAFQDLSNHLKDLVIEGGLTDGTTAEIAILIRDQIHTLTLGDARSVIIREDGSVKFATKDQKPDGRVEYERVLRSGGRVVYGRIDGVLAVSRSLGDYEFPSISHEPVYNANIVEENDRWLIIGCDGVFDVFTNENLGRLCFEHRDLDPTKLAQVIKNASYTRCSTDNISVIVIDLQERQRVLSRPGV